MGKLFGTDGIRGLANKYPMSPDLVLKLGQAIGLYFREHYPHPKILIGKDTRKSGYMLEQALCSGICSVGVDSFFVGPLPTPGIAYLTRGMRANAGIVISASHNPFHDNGIKIFSADGKKLPDSVENALEQMLEDPMHFSSLPTGVGLGRAKRIDDAIGQYAVFLKEQFPKNLTLEGMRLVIDCSNGAGYKVAPKVFSELGAEVFLLGVNPNGTNINNDCGALFPENLREHVHLYKADLGIALDGDADRLVVVDENGEIVDGDQILAISAIHMMKKKRLVKNTVVSTIMSNGGLEIALKKQGAKLLRTKVGDRYVFEAMEKEGLNLGGEPSGHLIFRDSSTTGDGILAALHLIEIMLTDDKPISQLKTCMKHIPQVVESIFVPEKIPFEKLPEFSKLIQATEKKLNGDGRLNLRYSGTESKLRVMIEGTNVSEIKRMASSLCEKAVMEIQQKSCESQ